MAETKTNAMRRLDKEKTDYQIHTYDPGGPIDGISVARKLGQDVNQVFKTLVAQGKSRGYYVFVIPAAEELDLKKAAKAVGEKSVELIPVKEINPVTGYIRGGCSPIGMKKQYPTVLDRRAESQKTIFVSGGRIGTQIEINPMDLAALIRATFQDLLL